MAEDHNAPLAGLRVLELARVLAGPWAGQLLADLGADVIKVERPDLGDDTRQWGPPFVHDAAGENIGAAYYHACNRGKRSVAADIASADGQQKVRALAAGADVVIENFRVGALKRCGLDAEALRAANPRLVYCSITGFGQDGPYASRAGYDFVIQAMAGLMSVTGEPDGPPQKAGIPVADLFTGVYSVVAILAALRQRERTGEGAHIDMSLLDTMAGVMSNQAMNWMVGGEPPPRMGNGHVNLAPYQSFSCADGDMIIAVGNDRQFVRLCEILGLHDLAGSPRFATAAARVANRQELAARLQPAIAARNCGELAAKLEAGGIPAGPVNAMDKVFADPQVKARGLQISVNERSVAVPGLASPIVIDGKRAVSSKASPRLGEDGDAQWL